jgi:uncharacterized damage-inducible protein DinB
VTTERQDLVELGQYAYGRLRERLDGLTDEEFAWEPAAGVSTLAWRIGHIAELLSEDRNAAWLGVTSPAGPAAAPSRSAAEAVAALEAAFDVWSSVVDAVPDSSLTEPVGPVGGPYADSTRRAFVLHVLDELIHHGAEVALVRDLWAAGHAAG